MDKTQRDSLMGDRRLLKANSKVNQEANKDSSKVKVGM